MNWNKYPETVPTKMGCMILKLFESGSAGAFFTARKDKYKYTFGFYASRESDGIIKVTEDEIIHKRWRGFVDLNGFRISGVVAWMALPEEEEIEG